jgi:hypothetical protein
MAFKKLQQMLRVFDRKIVALTVELPGKKYVLLLAILVSILILGASCILYASGRGLQIDLFFIPVIVACIFFRARGLLFFIPALLGYHLSYGDSEVSLFGVLLRDAVEFIKWSILAGIVLYAMNKFGDIKKFEDRVKQDVGLAKALQRTLLSKDFDLQKVRVFGYIHQCMEVGGDFYFLRPFKKKYVVMSIGDVMGKGIPASLVMAVIMGFFYEWGKKSYSPSFILDRINRRLIDLFGQGAWYSTLFYSIFDEETRELTFSNAGHQKGILLKASGELDTLEAEGFPVGVFADYQWEEKKITLYPGDRVIFFTDGVTEARSPTGQIYSLNRLLSRITETKSLPLEKILDTILKDVQSHSGPYFESDDVAVVMMEIKEPSPAGDVGVNASDS